MAPSIGLESQATPARLEANIGVTDYGAFFAPDLSFAWLGAILGRASLSGSLGRFRAREASVPSEVRRNGPHAWPFRFGRVTTTEEIPYSMTTPTTTTPTQVAINDIGTAEDFLADPTLDALAHSFIEAAPERMVWGSDWPHATASAGRHPYPDDARQIERLAQWAGDAKTLRRILVSNPERLYGFDPLPTP